MSDLVTVSKSEIEALLHARIEYLRKQLNFKFSSDNFVYAIDEAEEIKKEIKSFLDKATPCGEAVYQVLFEADEYDFDSSFADGQYFEVEKEEYEKTDFDKRRILYTTPQVPDGYAPVPIEPTEAMCIKAREVTGMSAGVSYRVYKAMLTEAMKGQ